MLPIIPPIIRVSVFYPLPCPITCVHARIATKLRWRAPWSRVKRCRRRSVTVSGRQGLLQTESDRELKADCAAALYNLARDQSNCQVKDLIVGRRRRR